ncbi:MAG: hypothetical protein Q9174_000478 [Haloplaca sp. 1 TL-2023]
MADSSASASDLVVRGSDQHTRLEDLVARATSKYSIKDYDAAAEFYSQATELQAEINGEMAADNADLLYAYGRCLYHVAVRSSDVLGARVAGQNEQSKADKASKSISRKDGVSANDSSSLNDLKAAEGAITSSTGGNGGKERSEDKQQGSAKPYFQFTGDENFEDSDDAAGDLLPDGDAGEEPEEEDDFANAFEVLDLARILLLKKLHDEEAQSQGQQEHDPSTAAIAGKVRQLKERLADTHDLQAEISLEGERFPNAVLDLRAALDLKKELFPRESSLIAEAHYKLSLALEFSSVTQQKTTDGETDVKAEAHVDEAMREDAAKEMEAAITSCKLRILMEKQSLPKEEETGGTMHSDSIRVKEQDIKDVKDMIADMEQRVSLRPIVIVDPTK